MNNVLYLAERRPARAAVSAVARLPRLFAQERHRPEDVRWLKENSELLRFLVATGQRPDPAHMAEAYGDFAGTLRERIRFFPQYYRFFLSLSLDLDALGVEGINSAETVYWAMSQDLAGAELSDLQRAEARLMASRAGCEFEEDPELTGRLLSFASRSEIFALPNRKAAYELTHIAFYLSDYGRHGFAGSGQMIESLHNAGLVAHLEGNIDLLSEICLALRFCGHVPPVEWDAAVATGLAGFRLLTQPKPSMRDEYHTWLMTAWSREVAEGNVLQASLPAGPFYFVPPPAASTLVEVSMALMNLGASRSGDWGRMRGRLAGLISRQALAHIDEVAASTPQFESFFARFARAP